VTEKLLIFAADLILIIHVAFVFVVICGLVAIYLGYFLKWDWIRNFWLRILHLVAIAIVVLQSWLGMICPLTSWEMSLREAAGGATYSGSFIQHWLQDILYYTAPEWVFILCYTVFGCLVLASWFIIPPLKKKDKHAKNT